MRSLALTAEDMADLIAGGTINAMIADGEEIAVSAPDGVNKDWTAEPDATRSTTRVRFSPEAWQRDYAVPVDAEGETEWLVSEDTATMVCSAVERDTDLDFAKDDEFAPDWIRNWSGPFTIRVVEQVCLYCGLSVHRAEGIQGLLVDERTGDWWCRANPSNGGDAAPHEVTR